MGTCKYTLARDKCEHGVPKGDPTWQVIINNDRNYPEESVAEVRTVRVRLYEYDLVSRHAVIISFYCCSHRFFKILVVPSRKLISTQEGG